MAVLDVPKRTSKSAKGGTAHSRKHRFESFTQRIAKLKIDPVRRSRRHELDLDDGSHTSSYFKASLEEWKELNLSGNFSDFAREVSPLSESLPQLLHFQDRVADLLCEYIDKRDTLSLEPFLSLVAHFAHDLGARFEKHYPRILALVTSLAAKHPDVEAIEWSFNCLSWLFKYLSRLLVPDLRPTYDMMAPLLGKEQQKAFVSRFAAEAMSFLVRKAGAAYNKDQGPLELLVIHTFEDLQHVKGTRFVSQYQQGLMALYSEAVKGIRRGLYSHGDMVFQCLLRYLVKPSEESRDVAEEIVCGVLINVAHHTDKETFAPIANLVLLEVMNSISETGPHENVEILSKLVFIIVGIRKGSRIENWGPILEATCKLLDVANLNSAPGTQTIPRILSMSAVVLQSSSMDVLLPNFRRVMDKISSPVYSNDFLPFCNHFSSLDSERFRIVVIPYLQKFLVNQWKDHELRLSALVPELYERNCLQKPGEQSVLLTCPDAWQRHILAAIESLRDVAKESKFFQHTTQKQVDTCQGYLSILACTKFEPKMLDQISALLLELASITIEGNFPADEPLAQLALGKGLATYVKGRRGDQDVSVGFWRSLCSFGASYASMPVFLQGVLGYLESPSVQLEFDTNAAAPFVDALISNVSGPDHEMRVLSLRTLQCFYKMINRSPSEDLEIALLIEETKPGLDTARGICMHIRALASHYEASVPDPWLSRIVPGFCFGLLTIKLAQAWDEAIVALQKITETKVGEDEVSRLCFRWLEEPSKADLEALSSGSEQNQNFVLTNFECSNIKILERQARRDWKALGEPLEKLHLVFVRLHRRVPPQGAAARAQALRVFESLPKLAEKRSRSLVPMFLESVIVHADNADEPDLEINSDSMDSSSTLKGSTWARKDQKAMLSVFSKFENPKVLYRSNEVYSALLELLTNGDVGIQKPALEAILAWKSPHLVPYQEKLRYLLDDARFNEEVSTVLQLNRENSEEFREHREQLMPVLLRLLYGRIIVRKRATGGNTGTEAKRRMVLKSLAHLTDEDLRLFINVALGPLRGIGVTGAVEQKEVALTRCVVNPRRQVGILNMIDDLVKGLGTGLIAFADSLLNAVLYCLIQSSRVLAASKDHSVDDPQQIQGSLHRSVRQVGFRCLNRLFKSCAQFDWSPFMPVIFQELLDPRLERFAIETAQSTSGTFQLFQTWSASPETILFLARYNGEIMVKIADCFIVPSAKEEIRLSALQIIRNAVELSEDEDVAIERRAEIANEVLRPNVEALLTRLSEALRSNPPKDILESAAELVHRLANHVTESSEARNLLQISLYLLNQPTRRVNPKTKSDLLQVLQQYLPLCQTETGALEVGIFNTISSLFAFFRDRASREILSQVLVVMAEKDAELVEVAELCEALNSYSASSIDEPDFDRRLDAYASINEKRYRTFTSRHWRPILFNMLYFVKDPEELSIRTSASMSLRRFIESAHESSEGEEKDAFLEILNSALIPDIQKGMRENSELVRAEYLTVLSEVIRKFPKSSAIEGMEVLLVGGDEEASFFNNVLHIQQHRRLRALRRLASEAGQDHLGSTSVDGFLIPLIEHFIFNRADDDSSHNLAAETVTTVGSLAERLRWPQFRSLLRKYIDYFQSKTEPEKIAVRLLSTIVDGFRNACAVKGYLAKSGTQSDTVFQESTDLGTDVEMPEVGTATPLSSTLPSHAKLAADITSQSLPPLTTFLNRKDESTVSVRVPVAIVIVKLLNLLPFQECSARLPAVLTDLSHILRSRAQESRDMTRKTLSEIVSLLGPSCLGFVVKELKGALSRGYQLHVLSYTVHSILVSATPQYGAGALDYCLPQLVEIAMDDIFGPTGQEKDAEDYISQMKEVRSSKSYDSMELLAKTTTLHRLPDLIRPIQALLQEKVSLKIVKKVDELLRRIGVGLLRNEAVESHDFLVLCFQIIQEAQKVHRPAPNRGRDSEYRVQKYLINLHGAKKGENRGSTSSYMYKLTRFSFDILRTVLHKHESLQTPSNLAGYIPLIGDALLQAHEEIQISAVRLLTTIIKVPLAEIDQNIEIYVAEAVRLIKGSPSSNTEIAQAALKLVSAILRDRRNVKLEETKLNSRLAYLLNRIKPDLEEPDRQGVTFNFLKAILGRKVMLPEVYEVLDIVAVIMVTNQTRGARDLARGVYFQFIMEYPQAKDRFAKQMSFLVKNLNYEYREGRQSVLEVIHLLLSKIGENMAQEVVRTFMVPLVMVLVNDDSAECREMSGVLIKEVFERADTEGTQRFLALLRTWISQDEQSLLTRVALQVYGFYFDVVSQSGKKQLSFVQGRLLQILQNSEAPEAHLTDWQLPYYALQLLSKLCEIFPTECFDSSLSDLWATVESRLSYPHAWVKLSAGKLIGLYLADFARNNADKSLSHSPLKGSGGLPLEADRALHLALRSIGMLKGPGVSEELASQCVRNLVFLGKYLGATELEWKVHRKEEVIEQSDDSEDEAEGLAVENGTAHEDSPEASRSPGEKLALERLFERLSGVLRRETFNTRAPGLIPKSASLQLIAALCNHLPEETLLKCLDTILVPLHHLTDETITAVNSTDEAYNEAYSGLRSTSQEILSLLQHKLGTSVYVAHYAKVQKAVRERREGRRIKRRIEAVTEPEKVQRDKKRKGDRMKARRKEKSNHERGKRRGW
ncbi:MAG: hypothetical protein M4579_004844 [Chaenotheca gracillima]|nr:MAG: hypothetical protein M4579_004844 [Chaenotheca gracillima]